MALLRAQVLLTARLRSPQEEFIMMFGLSGSKRSLVAGEIHNIICPEYLDGGRGFESFIAPQSAAVAVEFPR